MGPGRLQAQLDPGAQGRPPDLVALSPSYASLRAGSFPGGPLHRGMAGSGGSGPVASSPEVSEGQQALTPMCAWKLRDGCDWPVWVMCPSDSILAPSNHGGQSVLLCHWSGLLTWVLWKLGESCDWPVWVMCPS